MGGLRRAERPLFVGGGQRSGRISFSLANGLVVGSSLATRMSTRQSSYNTRNNDCSSAQSSKQGVVPTVQAFAASLASSEEFDRSSRQMNELLRIDKVEEAQRRRRGPFRRR